MPRSTPPLPRSGSRPAITWSSRSSPWRSASRADLRYAAPRGRARAGGPGALGESVGHALRRAESLRRVERAKPDSSDAVALREFADVASELAGNLRHMARPGPAGEALAHTKANLATLELLRRLQGARQ